MKTQENNIRTLVNADIISVDMPKMGGILIVNGIEFDTRMYYSGRGSKYNKSINHEQVVVKITQKELAKAMRHFKMNRKVKLMRNQAIDKAFSKSRPSRSANVYGLLGTMQYAYTKSSRLHYPELKEISRTKI